MKAILEAVEDNNGILGLIVQGTKLFDAATEGDLIAHDLVEHVNGVKAIGSVDDELEALGALWFVRGRTGQIRKNNYGFYSPEESISYDVANLGRYFYDGVDFRNPIPNTRAGDDEEAFQAILDFGRKHLKGELEDYEDLDWNRFNFYMKNSIHFIRTGFRKARKKYEDTWKANELFWNISDAVQPYAKNVSFEGQQFELTYTRTRAYVEEHYEEEY